MPVRGFCQHGKVWTTCPICGKEVIAAAAKRGSSSAMDDFVPAPRIRKKPVAAPEEEAAEPEAEPREEAED